MRNFTQQEPHRIVEVSWGDQLGTEYLVDVEIIAYDGKALLKDVSTVIAAEDVSVADMHTGVSDEDNLRRLNLTLRITAYDQLSDVLSKLQSVAGIIEVKRTNG